MEAFKLRVPKESYQQTINDLNSQLEKLESNKSRLRTIIGQLTGETFSGTDVQSTIEVAYDTLKRVDMAYIKITRQRDTIQEYLDSTEADASALDSNATQVRNNLPDLFK